MSSGRYGSSPEADINSRLEARFQGAYCFPKGSRQVYGIDTWALKWLSCHDFCVYVCMRMILGLSGLLSMYTALPAAFRSRSGSRARNNGGCSENGRNNSNADTHNASAELTTLLTAPVLKASSTREKT